MAEYKLTCTVDSGDYIVARSDRHGAALTAHIQDRWTNNVVTTPDALRSFARGLMTMADEVDASSPPTTVSVGDRFRVTEDGLEYASVRVGDVVTVISPPDGAGTFTARAGLDGTQWYFGVENVDNGLEPIDTPAKDSATSPAPSPRAAILEEARALVGSRDIGQLLDVARFLAEDVR